MARHQPGLRKSETLSKRRAAPEEIKQMAIPSARPGRTAAPQQSLALHRPSWPLAPLHYGPREDVLQGNEPYWLRLYVAAGRPGLNRGNVWDKHSLNVGARINLQFSYEGSRDKARNYQQGSQEHQDPTPSGNLTQHEAQF